VARVWSPACRQRHLNSHYVSPSTLAVNVASFRSGGWVATIVVAEGEVRVAITRGQQQQGAAPAAVEETPGPVPAPAPTPDPVAAPAPASAPVISWDSPTGMEREAAEVLLNLKRSRDADDEQQQQQQREGEPAIAGPSGDAHAAGGPSKRPRRAAACPANRDAYVAKKGA
jgi:hypothetical protein